MVPCSPNRKTITLGSLPTGINFILTCLCAGRPTTSLRKKEIQGIYHHVMDRGNNPCILKSNLDLFTSTRLHSSELST